MTTSNSTDFNQTRNDLCLGALRNAGVVGLEQSVSAAYLTHAASKLNQMLKHWENTGIHIWTQKHATVFLVPGQVTYSLGSGGDRATEDLVQTTTTAAAAAAASALVVDSIEGMTVLDKVGVVLDSGTTFWTTIASFTGTDTINLTLPITTAAASGNTVYTYTTAITDRPLKITSACIRNSNQGDRMLGDPMGRQDYQNLPDKNVSGTVFQFYYESLHGATGKLYLYQAPTYANETLQIEYQRSIQDMDSASENPDLPSSWLLAIEFNLAVLLCPAYGKADKQKQLEMMADRYLAEANNADFEALNVNMIPRYR